MKLEIKSFGGVVPRRNARLLQANEAQVALNCEARGETVKPIRGTAAVTAPTFSLGSATNAKTLYRFGQDESNETKYWLAWTTDVDVCRSQIADDPLEWTFYTDGAYPKMFNAATDDNVSYHWRLGIPAPYGDAEDLQEPSQRLQTTQTQCGPVIHLTETDWMKFTTTEGIQIYFRDERGTFNQGRDAPTPSREKERRAISLSAITLDAIYTALSAATFTNGMSVYKNEKANTITLVSGVGYTAYTMYLSWGGYRKYFVQATANRGGTGNLDDTFTIPAGAVNTPYNSTITSGYKAFRLRYGFSVDIYWGDDNPYGYTYSKNFYAIHHVLSLDKEGKNYTAAELDTLLTNNGLDATVSGTDVLVSYQRADGGKVESLYYGFEYYVRDNAGYLASRVSTEQNEERVYTWTYICDTSTITTPSGLADSGLVIESPPAPPSDPLRVSSTGSAVTVTFPADSTAFVPSQGGSNTENVKVTGKRLYRATAGEYLLVVELPLADTSFVDAVPAEFLGETLPTLDDNVAPSAMKGLINLPNGMMAGFAGRDLHFCAPYRPYAWPAGYSQTLDYPIVGLGRIDTTLVALTKGVPYFLQGSAPDVMVAVKSDIEQSCVSKRSIVSMGGAVLFASPDGLILLTTGGSKNLTEELFTRTQWQALLGATPDATFHAYGHDNQYIAFHAKATDYYADNVIMDYYGFIYNLATGQLTRHNIQNVTAGFQDLRNDSLLLAVNNALHRWDAGGYLTATWRSKLFTLPQTSGFSCAQVEAMNSQQLTGFKVAIYRSGLKMVTALVDDLLSSVTETRLHPRFPFRLEAKQGPDWEIQLNWTDTGSCSLSQYTTQATCVAAGGTWTEPTTAAEIFNVVMAQSMEELASA